jgi:hypothetical protein
MSEELNNKNKKAISTDEAFEYTKKKLTIILNGLLLDSNSDELLKFKTGSIVLHYKDYILEKIETLLWDNKISLDESITIKGAKKYKYFKERLRVILNRLISRLDEHLEYEDEIFDEYLNLINGYIYQVGTDYDLDLVDLDLDS